MADEQPYWHLRFACPKCQAKGMIPWDRLDRVVDCRRCSTWYRVGRDAKLAEFKPQADMQVAVRGSFSEWRRHRVLAADWATGWLSRGGSLITKVIEWLLMLSWPMRSLIAGGILVAIIASAIMASGGREEPTEPAAPLPTELVDRAPLFTAAWLAHDLPQMLRFTDKSHDRQLRQWSAKTPPPSKAATAKSEERIIQARVERREPHKALVDVRIALVSHAGGGADFVQHQQWVERDGGWYFLPQAPAAARNRPR
jgi:hypothetical protein